MEKTGGPRSGLQETMVTVKLPWTGQTLWLMPQKAVYWAERHTLVVTDTHFGKSAFFRARGLPVPRGVTEADLARLSEAIDAVHPRRLVILGDFLHAKGGRSPGTLRAIRRWRQAHADLEVVLIRGNHDRRAGDPPRPWKIRCVPNGFVDAPFAFTHEPDDGPFAYYALAGHVHPAVQLADSGGSSMRLPCFIFGPKVAVLPAFGGFTGCHTVRPTTEDRIFVVGPEVIEI